MIIAIDGPAGSGKSTIAKRVARMLGFHYLDTGAMYRCIALYAIEHGIGFDDAAALEPVAREVPIVFSHEPGNPVASAVSFDGVDVTAAIRTPEVDKAVSPVSAIPEVRTALVEQQRRIAAHDDIVMEGRDIGDGRLSQRGPQDFPDGKSRGTRTSPCVAECRARFRRHGPVGHTRRPHCS